MIRLSAHRCASAQPAPRRRVRRKSDSPSEVRSCILSRGSVRAATALVCASLMVCSISAKSQANPDSADAGGLPADATEVATFLPRLDAMLAGLDARIKDIRGQAEKMLDHADVAQDSEEQMRFEEMYGRLAAAAGELEAERDRLRSMRDELAAAVAAKRP